MLEITRRRLWQMLVGGSVCAASGTRVFLNPIANDPDKFKTLGGSVLWERGESLAQLDKDLDCLRRSLISLARTEGSEHGWRV